jgi:WD40 repeat protein
MKLKSPAFEIRASYELDFSPGGDRLLVVGRDVALWSVVQRKRLHTISYVRHPSNAVFSPDGSTIVIKDTQGSFMTCDSATTDPLLTFRAPERDEGTKPVFFDSHRFIDASWSGEIRIRSLNDLTPTTLWRTPNAMIKHIARSSSTWVFAVSLKHDHPNFESGGDFLLVTPDPTQGVFVAFPRTWRFLRTCALSPNGDRVAIRVGAQNPGLEIVDLPAAHLVCSVPVKQGGTELNVIWAPDGRQLIVAEDGGFSIRNADDLEQIGWWPTRYPADVAFSPDGAFVALADWKRGVVLSWKDLLASAAPSQVGREDNNPVT